MNHKASRTTRLMVAYFVRIMHSASFYPMTTFWIGAGLILSGSVSGRVPFIEGILAQTLLLALLIVIADHRDTVALRVEVAGVHTLVNKQHDDLVARVTQLINALEEAGLPVPKDPKDLKDSKQYLASWELPFDEEETRG